MCSVRVRNIQLHQSTAASPPLPHTTRHAIILVRIFGICELSAAEYVEKAIRKYIKTRIQQNIHFKLFLIACAVGALLFSQSAFLCPLRSLRASLHYLPVGKIFRRILARALFFFPFLCCKKKRKSQRAESFPSLCHSIKARRKEAGMRAKRYNIYANIIETFPHFLNGIIFLFISPFVCITRSTLQHQLVAKKNRLPLVSGEQCIILGKYIFS